MHGRAASLTARVLNRVNLRCMYAVFMCWQRGVSIPIQDRVQACAWLAWSKADRRAPLSGQPESGLAPARTTRVLCALPNTLCKDRSTWAQLCCLQTHGAPCSSIRHRDNSLDGPPQMAGQQSTIARKNHIENPRVPSDRYLNQVDAW